MEGASVKKMSLRTFLAKEPDCRGGRKGGWSAAAAQSPILGTTITLSRLRRKGYLSMLDYYSKSKPEIQ
ncbi:hypothetical protein SYJ56_25635 [Algoriphagus sp. D3-2-R+10]|nr:hypothetical protein [Algoriphagus sp. D3-2-R+10]